MEDATQLLLQWLQVHGLFGVMLFMLAESAGAPLPTVLGFATAQGLVDAGVCGPQVAFAWIAGGHVLGAALSYHLGRASDSALTKYLSHKPSVVDVQEKMRRWYAKYGPLAILFGRLVGQVRPWSSFVAGLSRVPVLPFYLWTVVGTAVFTVVTMWLTAVGYKYWQAHPKLGTPMIVTMMIIFYGLPLYKGIEHLVKRHRCRRLAAERAAEAAECEETEAP